MFFQWSLFPRAHDSAFMFVCVLSLAGIHHDCVPAPELAWWPPVLQSHQQDTGVGQSICGQAVAARHFHRQCQICLVPRCHRGEQVDPPAAQWSHSIQQPVWANRLLSSLVRDSQTLRQWDSLSLQFVSALMLLTFLFYMNRFLQVSDYPKLMASETSDIWGQSRLLFIVFGNRNVSWTIPWSESKLFTLIS